jgi:hypothetical protein
MDIEAQFLMININEQKAFSVELLDLEQTLLHQWEQARRDPRV